MKGIESIPLENHTVCPSCKSSFVIPYSEMGSGVKCPNCGKTLDLSALGFLGRLTEAGIQESIERLRNQ